MVRYIDKLQSALVRSGNENPGREIKESETGIVDEQKDNRNSSETER